VLEVEDHSGLQPQHCIGSVTCKLGQKYNPRIEMAGERTSEPTTDSPCSQLIVACAGCFSSTPSAGFCCMALLQFLCVED